MNNKTWRILACPVAFNEEGKIGAVIRRFKPGDVTEVMVVDDGSTDGTARVAKEAGASVLSHPQRQGVGAAVRTAIHYGRDHGFDILVILAGNDKDRPEEIHRLLDPITQEGYDFVHGSRHLPAEISLALTEAETGKTGVSTRKMLSYCFSYDPVSRRYTADILRIAGLVMTAVVVILLTVMLRPRRNKARPPAGGPGKV